MPQMDAREELDLRTALFLSLQPSHSAAAAAPCPAPPRVRRTAPAPAPPHHTTPLRLPRQHSAVRALRTDSGVMASWQ